ncbi:hypothetical protein CLOM_g5916 [Closterium sp. NIES-68]|nr:hypothetical protein CLOM_g5916 [Closterium sp. NIES-68]GJP63251.1 hypothetical protein CLOP_g20311 [Closterium sp. NIES-67]
MASSVMEEVRKVMAIVTDGNEQLQQAQEQASAVIRETTASARQQMAVMEAAASEHLQEAKASFEVARETYTQYEDIFFHHLKMGVYLASEHRVASSAILLSSLAFVLPGPRKMLYRATFGRFQTPEVLVESAERKLEGLKQSVEVFKNDTKKLQERAQMAESEFISGRDKLRAAGAEMQRLAGTVRAAEKKSQGLRELLKDLPARDSVRLRSELAMATREAQRQLHAINKTTVHVARLGIPI